MAEKHTYKAKVTLGDATVEVEGAESGVVAIVRALSETWGTRTAESAKGRVTAPPTTPPVQGPADPRTFFEQKNPSNDREAVACAAFYLQYLAPEDRRSDSINAIQLEDAFRLANWPIPASVKMALVHAKNAGYLDPAGERGQYKLNPVGYNLVQHTLGQAEVAEGRGKRKPAKATRRAAGRRRSRKGNKKS